jgi:hypothetical protein
MQRRVSIACAVLALACSVGGVSDAQAATYRFDAILDQAQETSPPTPVLLAHGSGSVFYDDVHHSLTWSIIFGGLSGDPTAAHIHLGDVGVAGIPLVGLGTFIPLIGPGFGAFVGGGALPAMHSAALLGEDTYINIHTGLNPSGEIRGQLLFHSVVVPVPAAGVLLASALGALALRRRRHA